MTTQLEVEKKIRKTIKKIKNLFFIILMIPYTILQSNLMIFMRMFFKLLMIFFILLFPFFEVGAFEKKGRFSVGGGIHNYMKNGYDRCDNSKGGCNAASGGTAPVSFKDSSTVYSIEYFASKRVIKILKPFIGFNGTDKDAYYGYFGFSTDLYFLNCKCFIITPTLAVGWYIDGEEIKLGNRVQFRSGGDIYYRFKNNVRVGVGLYHISNAGLGDSNPGAEQAILKYQIPF